TRGTDDTDAIRNLEVVFHTRLEKTRVELDDLEEFRKFHEDVNREYRVWVTMRPVSDIASAERLEQLLTVAPQNTFTSTPLARIYTKSGRLADARRVLDRARYYTPDETELSELRVKAAETAHDEEASQRELVKRHPDNLDHALALGAILIGQGKQ